MRILLCIIFCLAASRLTAQVADSAVYELAGMPYVVQAEKNCYFLTTPKDSVSEKDIPALPFTRTKIAKGVSGRAIERDCYVRLTLHNAADTARSVYFTPGYYLKKFKMYEADSENIRAGFHELKNDSPSHSSGYFFLTVPPHRRVTYFAKFDYVRTNINLYTPRIIQKEFLLWHVLAVRDRNADLNVITYIASGILLLMIIYSTAVFAQNRQGEFLYYSAYASLTGILLFLKAYLDYRNTVFNFFFEEYLDLVIMCASVFFYLAFIRKFLSTGSSIPLLDKMLRVAIALLAALIIVFSIIYFYTDKYIILNIFENFVIKMMIFVTSIIVIVYSFLKRDPLLNYLAAGNISLMFFSIVSLGIMVFGWRIDPRDPVSLFNRSFLYYEVGLVAELALFLFGLAYKNKVDIIAQVKEREHFKLEAERKEFEKQMAMMAVRQEERDRISADMHDDLGSGVTAIRLMSEIVKSKMNTEQFPEIDKISNSANELLGKMNSIIWTMKSSNDTVESLVAYLRAYATEYFDSTPVDCTVDVEDVVEREMSGEKRRNIFLCFKETLNNILKHAQATTVKISIRADENKLVVTIHDNGVGIDLKNLRRFGNGLNNIRKRMQSINGEFIIGHDNGTIVCLEVRLNAE